MEYPANFLPFDSKVSERENALLTEVPQVDCRCQDGLINRQLQKFEKMEGELVDVAKRILRTASDPISAVVRFLHERPDDSSLPGYVIDRVLVEVFDSEQQIPGLVKLLAGHVKTITRHRNYIDILKEHPGVERWGSYLIKQTETIKFEVAREKDKLCLRNIGGLIAIEHGMEIPLDKILVNPPKLEITLRLGLLRPQRIVDIA